MEEVEQYVLMMDTLEDEYVPAFREEFGRAFTRAAQTSVLSRQQQTAETLEHRQRLRVILDQLWRESIEEITPIILENLKADTTQQTLDRYLQLYSANRDAQIADSTFRLIREFVARRQAQGLTMDQISDQLATMLPGMSANRALMVARTEIHSASQFAAHDRVSRLGVPVKKIWNTVLDERTRDFGEGGTQASEFNHRAMHRIEVPISGYFTVPRLGGGTEQLLFPGDPNGSAGNIINCRCVQTYKRMDS